MDDTADLREPSAFDATHDLAARDEPADSKGVAFGVVGLVVTFFVLLPAFIAVGVYTSLTVYAVVKGVEGGSDVPDPTTIMVGLVLLVTLFVLLVTLGAMLLGRMADPKKRH
jgi:ABC-type Na+ efflux pump permease subunit